jgi:molybdate transport system regulatory protein
MTTKSHTKLIANGRIWIDTAGGPFLGYGRIELLEKIHALGSIRQAALEMKMSYRQAWQLIEQMNHQSEEVLVISHRGGKGGGQAVVTEAGRKAIAQFREFNRVFQDFLKNYNENLNN